MKKILSIIAIASILAITWACNDDETSPDSPVVTAPASTSVTIGAQLTLTFTATTPGGFKDATVSVSPASAGTATVTTKPTAGATAEGNVVVTFTAGNSAASAEVILTVTDNNNKSDSEDATVTISNTAVPIIAGIPPTAQLVAGATLEVAGATLTAADGFATSSAFTVTVNGGTPIDLSSLITGGSPATVNISYPTSIDQIGTNTLLFTLTDSDGDQVSFTHILTLVAPTFPVLVVNDNIAKNTTWSNDTIYELASRVIVEPTFTLTIEAGTVIKAQPGSGVNATALIIARGADIIADGTAAAPIIFTSTSDQIFPGIIKSPNLTETNTGLWGGLIILGNAPISDADNNGEAQIEGVPADVGLANYGGTVSDDNSGILDYVSVRHGGTVLGEGSEINGITLGGVGSATIVTNIEVIGNLDDGVELFGGSVNVTNVMIWAPEDDGLDIDQAYSGIVDNVIVIATAGTDHNLEIDGPEGNLVAGRFTITNVSIKGVDDELADLRENSTGLIDGFYSFGFASAATNDEGDFALSTGTVVGATGTGMNFANMQHTLAGADLLTDVFPATVVPFVVAVSAGANTEGADETKFNWTSTYLSGAVTGF